jgi:predicted nucleic acid-binding protein
MKNGINAIGISDLIIAQNAIQNDLHLLSLDKHFNLMAKHVPLSVYKQ